MTTTPFRHPTRWVASALMALAIVAVAEPAGAQDRSCNPQYGFAHRVNDWDVIIEVLDARYGGGSVAGNGIEFDIGYSTHYGRWIVSHDSFSISQPASEYVWEWLGKLKQHLDTGLYNQSFAALWVDIKTPNDDDLMTIVDLVRANVPSSVAVIYDIGGLGNFQPGGNRGYNILKNAALRPNEGIGAWAGSVSDVNAFYQIFKRDQIVRNIVHHGHAVNIDEDILGELNLPQYHDIRDPYRNKKVFTWTNDLQAIMQEYINPTEKWHTDGQIVGAGFSEWYGYFGELEDFDNAIAAFSTTQRKADRLDDFWGRSGSDHVSGDLIFVNNNAAGACQKGTTYAPFGTVTGGLNFAANNGTIVIAPGAPYTAVTRMAKPVRLEKAAGAGTVRITN